MGLHRKIWSSHIFNRLIEIAFKMYWTWLAQFYFLWHTPFRGLLSLSSKRIVPLKKRSIIFSFLQCFPPWIVLVSVSLLSTNNALQSHVIRGLVITGPLAFLLVFVEISLTRFGHLVRSESVRVMLENFFGRTFKSWHEHRIFNKASFLRAICRLALRNYFMSSILLLVTVHTGPYFTGHAKGWQIETSCVNTLFRFPYRHLVLLFWSQ